MTVPPACPDAPSLQRFLLGWATGTEAERLEEHVADCPRCLESLGILRADDELVQAARGEAVAIPGAYEELALAAIPVLKRLRPHDPTASWASDSAGEATLPPLRRERRFGFWPAASRRRGWPLGQIPRIAPPRRGRMAWCFSRKIRCCGAKWH